jgi:DNA-binding MarR family transcriptional regulator
MRPAWLGGSSGSWWLHLAERPSCGAADVATVAAEPSIPWHSIVELQYYAMESSSPGTAREGEAADAGDALEVLQSVTRILTGVALRSLDVLNGAVTLAQFRMLAVLADVGPARSVQVARALGLEASTITRLADRLVGAGYAARGSEPGHRGVVTLELTAEGRQLVSRVAEWRQQELARMLARLPVAHRAGVTAALRQLVAAAGEGYGIASRALVPA